MLLLYSAATCRAQGAQLRAHLAALRRHLKAPLPAPAPTGTDRHDILLYSLYRTARLARLQALLGSVAALLALGGAGAVWWLRWQVARGPAPWLLEAMDEAGQLAWYGLLALCLLLDLLPPIDPRDPQ